MTQFKYTFGWRTNELIRVSIVVSISACHADDPGSIPGRGVVCFGFGPIAFSCSRDIKCCCSQSAVWSSGMIPASGAGGPGFDPRNSPLLIFAMLKS